MNRSANAPRCLVNELATLLIFGSNDGSTEAKSDFWLSFCANGVIQYRVKTRDRKD